MSRALILILVCSLIIGCSSFSSFAEVLNGGYEYDSLEEAIERIEEVEKDNVVTTSERKEFIKEISPEAMDELVEEAYDEAAEKASELQATFRVPLEGDFEPMVEEAKYNLEVGGSVEVKIIVEPTPEPKHNTSNIMSKVRSLFIQPVYASNFGYGSLTYTTSYTFVHWAVPDSLLVLKTNYRVGDYGLICISTNSVGTHGTLFVAISPETWVEDDIAPVVGHDINGRGDYKMTLGPIPKLGLGLTLVTKHIRSYVKLNYINKTKKYVDLTFAREVW